MYSGYYGPASVASSSTSSSSGSSSRITASSAYVATQQTLYSPSLYSPPQAKTHQHFTTRPSTGARAPRHPTMAGEEDDLWTYVNQDPLDQPAASSSPSYLKAAASPFGSPSSSSSSSNSSGSSGQTVTFTSCPKCNTVEHHFIQSSRTCGRCGHTRYFSTSSSPKSSSMSSSSKSSSGRSYWRPTRYTTSISYAHVIEGREDIDTPVHEALATWASYQRQFILAMATSVSQMTTDNTGCPAFNLDLGNASGGQGSTNLSVVDQGMLTFATLQSDDLLGSFKVLLDEHNSRRSRGQRGIVVAVLNCRGASLAFACRLDDGTM